MASSKSRGRPSKFSIGLSRRILELAQSGLTDAQIAKRIGVTATTFHNWKHVHPDFFEALKDAKWVADQLVMVALFQRAVGYSHPAVKFFFDRDSGRIYSQRYTEHYPPDTTACIFWLKNRQRKNWQESSKAEEPQQASRFIIIDKVNEDGEKSGATELRSEPER